MSSIEYANILVERRGPVGIVTLNRPQALNALNAALIADLGAALDDLEGDERDRRDHPDRQRAGLRRRRRHQGDGR